MRLLQFQWAPQTGWQSIESFPADLVLIFGSAQNVQQHEVFAELRRCFPEAHFIGCSTAGEIIGSRVFDQTLVATAVKFDKTRIAAATVSIEEPSQSYERGKQLAAALPHEQLRHVFVLSNGTKVNGSQLVQGMLTQLPTHITVTGGLAANYEHMQDTYVIAGDQCQPWNVTALGFYGESITVGCGTQGGWDPFGPERLITRSVDNILYELDGKSALSLYKMYLGDQAEHLPQSALYFPLSMRTTPDSPSVVRTILQIDEKYQSMISAGDLPTGNYVRLMKSNVDRLISGAIKAAQESCDGLANRTPELAIIVSCYGRKLIFDQRIEEELEGIQEVLGENTPLAGFYSFGEIGPMGAGKQAGFHNETMTITTFTE